MAASRLPGALALLPLIAALAASAACAGKTRPAAEPATPAPAAAPAPAAPAGTAVAAPRSPASAPLLGHLTREQVKTYVPWQPLFVEPYRPDAAAIAAIRANADGIGVLLVMATWCPDSRRELPRFFAVMDGAGLTDTQLTMVGVDRSKKDAEGLTETWGITRVPTFVFTRGGQEVGRVVEKVPPGATLEGEIARILAGRR